MAQQPFGQVEVDQESWRQFQREVRRSTDVGLPKRIGQANKQIGQRFISEWLEPKPDPAAVGTGAGAAVRPSASKREVLLRVGGKHRENDSLPEPTRSKARYALAPWGRKYAGHPGRRAPKRPYIRQSVERHRDEISDVWLEAVAEAMAPAFYETEPR